jgi:hypothetical protein
MKPILMIEVSPRGKDSFNQRCNGQQNSEMELLTPLASECAMVDQ